MSCNVYIVQAGECVKIGVSNNVKKRMRQIQTSNPEKLYLILLLNMPSRPRAEKLEEYLHDKFSNYRCTGGREWFKVPFRTLKTNISNIDLDMFYDMEVHKENDFIPINTDDNGSFSILTNDNSEKYSSVTGVHYLTTKEAAERLGITDRSVRRRVCSLRPALKEYTLRQGNSILIDSRLVEGDFKAIKEVYNLENTNTSTSIKTEDLKTKDKQIDALHNQISQLNSHINKLIELMGQNNKIVINALS